MLFTCKKNLKKSKSGNSPGTYLGRNSDHFPSKFFPWGWGFPGFFRAPNRKSPGKSRPLPGWGGWGLQLTTALYIKGVRDFTGSVKINSIRPLIGFYIYRYISPLSPIPFLSESLALSRLSVHINLCSLDIFKARTQKSHPLNASLCIMADANRRDFRRRALQKSCKFGR